MESRFLSYKINGYWVHAEIIAPNLADTILQHPTEKQNALIAVILNLVPEVGDHEVIVDDYGDGRKRRGARVVRMKDGEDGQVNLLLTR